MPWRMRNELMTLCAFIISCINSSSTFSRMYNVRVRSTMDKSDSPHGVRSSRLICRKLEKKHSSYLLWHVTANAHCPNMQITDLYLYLYICLCMMSIYHCLDRIDAKSDNSQTRRLLVDAEKWFDLKRTRVWKTFARKPVRYNKEPQRHAVHACASANCKYDNLIILYGFCALVFAIVQRYNFIWWCWMELRQHMLCALPSSPSNWAIDTTYEYYTIWEVLSEASQSSVEATKEKQRPTTQCNVTRSQKNHQNILTEHFSFDTGFHFLCLELLIFSFRCHNS